MSISGIDTTTSMHVCTATNASICLMATTVQTAVRTPVKPCFPVEKGGPWNECWRLDARLATYTDPILEGNRFHVRWDDRSSSPVRLRLFERSVYTLLRQTPYRPILLQNNRISLCCESSRKQPASDSFRVIGRIEPVSFADFHCLAPINQLSATLAHQKGCFPDSCCARRYGRSRH